MILVALGSNLTGPWGTPKDTVLAAIRALQHEGIVVERLSTLFVTKPYGNTNQPDFVNAVARIRTSKTPDALMRCLHMIERKAGRQRRKHWGPRTLDLDLIDYHGLVRTPRQFSNKPLTLPHPGIAQRSFVLAPLVEIAPRWRHPVSHELAAVTLRKLHRLNAA